MCESWNVCETSPTLYLPHITKRHTSTLTDTQVDGHLGCVYMDEIHFRLRFSTVWDSKTVNDFLCLYESIVVVETTRRTLNSGSYCVILLLDHRGLMVEYKGLTKKLWIFDEHLLGISTAEWTQLDFSTTFEISTMGEIRPPVHFVSCKQNWQNKEIWIGKK